MKNLLITLVCLFALCMNLSTQAQNNENRIQNIPPSNVLVKAYVMPQQVVYETTDPRKSFANVVSYGINVGKMILPNLMLETGIATYQTNRMIEDVFPEDQQVVSKFVEVPVQLMYHSPLQLSNKRNNVSSRVYGGGGINMVFANNVENNEFLKATQEAGEGFSHFYANMTLGFSTQIARVGFFLEPTVKFSPNIGNNQVNDIVFKTSVGLKTGIQIGF